jgi:prepilin-type N-terminal cleavage/methylation domain-containing protein
MVNEQPGAPRAGFGLVEVTVTVALLSIAVMSVTANAMFTQRLLRRAEVEEDAARLAETLLDSLSSLPAESSGSSDTGRFHVQWNRQVDDVVVTVTERESVDGQRISFHAVLAPQLDTLPCDPC